MSKSARQDSATLRPARFAVNRRAILHLTKQPYQPTSQKLALTPMTDLRFAFRQLLKSPAFTLVAVLTLGLGIAASTAVFSVVDAVLLHPLPYPHSEQIVTVAQTVRSTGVSYGDASPANFIDWSAQNSVFSAMACGRSSARSLSGGEQPESVRATTVSGQFFSLFQTAPLLGRTLGPEDAKPGNEHVVVLGHALWTRLYAVDRGVIGKELLLDGEKYHRRRGDAARL